LAEVARQRSEFEATRKHSDNAEYDEYLNENDGDTA
jgi:hypothetical protein